MDGVPGKGRWQQPALSPMPDVWSHREFRQIATYGLQ
jgi:hypothetical protein